MSVSLGKGSILLIGNTKDHQDNLQQQQQNEETRGLVQLRVVLLDEENDTQETSLYVEGFCFVT